MTPPPPPAARSHPSWVDGLLLMLSVAVGSKNHRHSLQNGFVFQHVWCCGPAAFDSTDDCLWQSPASAALVIKKKTYCTRICRHPVSSGQISIWLLRRACLRIYQGFLIGRIITCPIPGAKPFFAWFCMDCLKCYAEGQLKHFLKATVLHMCVSCARASALACSTRVGSLSTPRTNARSHFLPVNEQT